MRRSARLALVLGPCAAALLGSGLAGALAGPSLALRSPSPHAAQDPEPDPSHDPSLGPPLRVSGRLVDESGAPLAGVRPVLSFQVANEERVRAFGVPEAWTPPAIEPTDAEGRFSFTFAPPRAYRFQLSARPDGRVRAWWSWSGDDPRAALDLGEVALARPTTIRGHVEDELGELLIEGWSVVGREDGPRAAPRFPVSVQAPVDADTGGFRLEGLPPGPVVLHARGPGGETSDDVRAIVPRDGADEVVLVVHRSVDGRVLRVAFDSAPFSWLHPEPGTVHALDLDGERVPVEPTQPFLREWRTGPRPPGALDVVVEDPRFERLRVAAVPVGQLTRVPLRGSARLALDLRDARGLRVERARVLLAGSGASSPGRTVTLAEPGTPLPVDGDLGAVVPGDWRLRVEVDGYPPRLLDLGTVAPGERRRVEARLAPGVRLTGRVVDAAGAPRADTRVQLTLGAEAGMPGVPGNGGSVNRLVDGEWRFVGVPVVEAETRTDATGAFAFEDLGAGPVALRALDGPWVRAERTVEVGGEDARTPDLVLPPSGTVTVDLRLPPDVPADEHHVRVEPAGVDPMWLRTSQVLRSRGERWGRRAHEDDAPPHPLPVGPVTITVSRHWPRPGVPGHVVLRELRAEVRAGETTAVACDLTRGYPVDGTVRLTLEGNASPSAEVSLRPRPGPIGDPSTPPQGAHGVQPDAEGTYDLRCLRPGTYDLSAFDPIEGWHWADPRPLVVTDQPFSRAVDLTRVRRTVRVVDAAGAPLAHHEVAWGSEGQGFTQAHGRTDAEGRLELHLPPGEYRVLVGHGAVALPQLVTDAVLATGLPLTLDRGSDELRLTVPD